MAAKTLKKSAYEPNLQDKKPDYAGIHLLLDRKHWHNHPGWKEAIGKELSGIVQNGTWNYDEVSNFKGWTSKTERANTCG